MQSNEALKACAEAVFKVVETAPETRASAMDEYKDRQQAELDKTAWLRALRLAREAAKS